MKSDEQLIWEQYLIESPWNIWDIDEDKFEDFDIDIIIKKSTMIDNYNDISIYENIENDKITYYFIYDNYLVSFYTFKYTPDGIRTILSWNSKKYKGIFYDIFINYLLPKFKYIESDEMLSNKGFQFWDRLSKNYQIYIKDNNNITPINPNDDILKYKDSFNIDMKYTTFVIKYDNK